MGHLEEVREIVALVPAAGASRRMGRPKLTMAWGEGSVVGRVVSALAEGGAGRISLVVGPREEDGARAAAELRDFGRTRGLVVAENPEPERGMLSSILCGLEALGGADALRRRGVGLLVSPADLPALRGETVAAVVAALRAGAALAVPVHGGRRGHPLGIAPALLGELAELDPGVGLRQLVERHARRVVEVAVDDPGAVHDVDTPEDYRRLAGLDSPP
jgi:molybdenum cofactor cytidylyltransferase